MRRVPVLSPSTLHAPEPALGVALLIPVSTAIFLVVAMMGATGFGWSLSPATWNFARGSGLALYVLSWWLLVSGLTGRAHLLRQSGRREIVLSLHTYAAHVWLGFLTLHILSLVADPTIYFGPVNVLVPFQSTWREPWTGLGVVAAEAGVVVVASSGLRRVLGYRTWKAVHWLSLPVFVMGLAHGAGAGTDRNALPVFLMYVVTTGIVVFLAVYRFAMHNALNLARESRAIPVSPTSLPGGRPTRH